MNDTAAAQSPVVDSRSNGDIRHPLTRRDSRPQAEHGQEPYADMAETHSAVVFFAGDRAYKLKKPVRTGFLDFSTPQARAGACQRETELNRRFARDVYLGVAEVRGPGGGPCDHLVVMRRMPAARRLSALIRAGEPAGAAVRQVARMLAVQHASAPRGPAISEQGTRDALGRRWADNIEQIHALVDGYAQAAQADEVQRLARRFLAGRAALFDRRIRDGRIVDGHGDLLADDIFCLDDGPRILDCLDFDDRLRWLDGLDDAAFLAMDLERLGAGGLARRFLAWYAEYAGDPAPVPLLYHYLAYRAFVRAKVDQLRSRQGDPQAGALASQLTTMTLRYLRAGAATLVLIGGLPGTGKSTLAGILAGRLGCTVLSSDRIRKELAGLPPLQHAAAPYGAGIYTPFFTERTYQELLHRAAQLLAVGELVIADASWMSAAHRAAAAALAGQASADLIQIQCTAPPALAARRVSTRAGSTSDAGAAVAADMAAAWAPWPEALNLASGTKGTRHDQAGWPAALVQQALHAIRPPGPDRRPARPSVLPG